MGDGFASNGPLFSSILGYFRCLGQYFAEGPSPDLTRRIEQHAAEMGHRAPRICLDRLSGGDTTEWARLLMAAEEDATSADYEQLKAVSPYKGKILIFAAYGVGFVTLKGDIKKFFAQAATAHGKGTMNCQEHLLAFDEEDPASANFVDLT